MYKVCIHTYICQSLSRNIGLSTCEDCVHYDNERTRKRIARKGAVAGKKIVVFFTYQASYLFIVGERYLLCWLLLLSSTTTDPPKAELVMIRTRRPGLIPLSRRVPPSLPLTTRQVKHHHCLLPALSSRTVALYSQALFLLRSVSHQVSANIQSNISIIITIVHIARDDDSPVLSPLWHFRSLGSAGSYYVVVIKFTALATHAWCIM